MSSCPRTPGGGARRRRAASATSAAVLAVAALGAALLPSAARAGGAENYLALGDSYAYGYQTLTLTPPASYGSVTPVPLGGGSDGNQGYVSLFASYLAARDGASVNVLSLARPGETSGSFSGSATSPTQAVVGGQTVPINFNTNYAGSGYTQSQSALLSNTLAAPGFAADVRYVTFQLGGNDIVDLVNSSAFQSESAAQQQTDLQAAFTTLAINDTAILASLRSALPTAQIFVLGYPNAFAGLSGSTLGAYFDPLVQNSTLLYQQIAAQPNVNAKFVNLYAPFSGHEADWTWINTTERGAPDYHPNTTGYQQIAGALVSAAAPEPGTLALLALPLLLGGAALGATRRRRAA